MIEVPHPSCAAAARAHVAMLRASGSYRHHLTLLSSHVCSLTRVKRTPSTSETAGGGEALGNAKEGGGEGASIFVGTAGCTSASRCTTRGVLAPDL